MQLDRPVEKVNETPCCNLHHETYTRLMKVGITNKPKQRFRQLKSETPFEFSVFSIVRMSGGEAIDLEKHYHRKYERIGFIGFNGCTEWLKYSKELIEEITYETSKNKRKDSRAASHIAEPDRPTRRSGSRQ